MTLSTSFAQFEFRIQQGFFCTFLKCNKFSDWESFKVFDTSQLSWKFSTCIIKAVSFTSWYCNTHNITFKLSTVYWRPAVELRKNIDRSLSYSLTKESVSPDFTNNLRSGKTSAAWLKLFVTNTPEPHYLNFGMDENGALRKGTFCKDTWELVP